MVIIKYTALHKMPTTSKACNYVVSRIVLNSFAVQNQLGIIIGLHSRQNKHFHGPMKLENMIPRDRDVCSILQRQKQRNEKFYL